MVGIHAVKTVFSANVPDSGPASQVAALDVAANATKLQQESAKLLSAHRQRQHDPKYTAMQKTRAGLPAYSLRKDIVAMVKAHQVDIVYPLTLALPKGSS